MGYALPVPLTIRMLLAIIVRSYFQTIHGYPLGGGAFTVTHDKLGVWPGPVAASALLIDCVWTVSDKDRVIINVSYHLYR